MPEDPHRSKIKPEEIQEALQSESESFEIALHWLEDHMPSAFFEEIDPKSLTLIARSLLSFPLQDCYSEIHLRHMAIVLCLQSPDADLRILKHFGMQAIRYYRTFNSNEPPPFFRGKSLLCIAIVVHFDTLGSEEKKLVASRREEIQKLVRARNPKIDQEEFDSLLGGLTPRFLRSMTNERLTLALDLFFRAESRDLCQYEIRRIEDWKAKESPSVQLVLAWKNVPKHRFLYRLAAMTYRHGLAMQRMVATYIQPYSTESKLIFSLGLHGLEGKAAWEEADLDDFLRELCLLKFFETDDAIEATFVQTRLLTGNQAHLIRSLLAASHQVLVYADPNLYSMENVEEGFCRHPELTVQICQAFEAKFHPETSSLDSYFEKRNKLLALVDNLDTGQAVNDMRRRNILKTAINFIDHLLKTNFYRKNKSAFAFRLDPKYLDFVPYDRKDKFPELPYGIFFIRGRSYLGFQLRFKDLARGGVRTVITERTDQFLLERNSIFSEAYNLAYTQQKKNKDIPEGGAKTAILLEPFDAFAKEEEIYRQEMDDEGIVSSVAEEKLKIYRKDHKIAFLYESQRSFIETFVTLVNCDDTGKLKAKDIVDYWKRPEYIYLGPDENMHNSMIEWIANYAVEQGYRPGRSFMSSKPGAGINHKEYGVTSFGVNVCMEETLRFLGIDPKKDPFTIKISGGPDGDVAGNQILNLYKYYPNTAKLLALVDISGTIYDPNGLDLKEMAELFQKALPLRNFPPDKLSEGGFLLDLRTKREQTAYAQQTLCWKKKGGKLVEEWLSGNEMNHLYRSNVHQTKTDIFVPGGGRPRTLNETNYKSFLDETGKPTAKAIVEGANLYLTPEARRELEKLGVLILKDSSCNKGGVICSSFEVLASLCISAEEFLKEKQEFVKEVLVIIGKAAESETRLVLSTFQKKGGSTTEICDLVSARINLFKYQILDYFETIDLPKDPSHPLIRCLLLYCPPLLRNRYPERILAMPEIHKKAVIACFIAARLVYSRGLDWSPSVIDILSTLATDPDILGE